MNQRGDILLVGETLQTPGNRALQKALADLGEISLVEEGQIMQALADRPCKLLILDASQISTRGDHLIRAVKTKYPQLQIVLFTASPHWKIAKAAIKAGAEYIEKSQDPKILAERFAPVIELFR